MHFQHFQEQVEIGLHQKSIQKNTNPVAPTVPFQPCSALKISLSSRKLNFRGGQAATVHLESIWSG
jgi:hypothetical protein